MTLRCPPQFPSPHPVWNFDSSSGNGPWVAVIDWFIAPVLIQEIGTGLGRSESTHAKELQGEACRGVLGDNSLLPLMKELSGATLILPPDIFPYFSIWIWCPELLQLSNHQSKDVSTQEARAHRTAKTHTWSPERRKPGGHFYWPKSMDPFYHLHQFQFSLTCNGKVLN